jgi:hypothetical protein
MDAIYKYGPFVHGLNRGGLKGIISESQLRGATASNHLANDRYAVRAYAGTFEEQKRNKRWSGRDKTFIEFMTMVPPRAGLPPGYAEWSDHLLMNNHLKIRILRVLNGEGEAIAAEQIAM